MRQIKFRAWMKEQKKMIYEGFKINPGGEISTYGLFDRLELMQFTGLTDKNGKEIWEGDIVEWDDCSKGEYWRVAIVCFDPDLQYKIIKNIRHSLSASEGSIFHHGCFAYQDTHNYLEVIGNIYENPELLEVEK